jgi:hypothetical protein
VEAEVFVKRTIHNFWVVLPSGQKLILGLLATITLEVVPFRTYTPFPALLPLSKCILEVVFCEGIQHCLRFCLHHLSFVKTTASKFYLQLGKQVACEGVGSRVIFWSEIIW